MASNKHVPSSSTIVPFNFHGDILDVIPTERAAYVSIRHVCEVLGVDASGQIAKLKTKRWASMEIISMQVAGAAQARPHAFLDIRALPMWLATIEASKVRVYVRAKLERYQAEAADALADHFLGARIANLEETVNAIVSAKLRVMGVAGSRGARVIAESLKRYADLMAIDGDKKDRRRWLGRGTTELRGHVGWCGVGRRFRDLPNVDLHRAKLKLAEMLRMAETNNRARRQPNLPGLPVNAAALPN